MNIRELIDQLESFANEHGDDTEVRLASQPNWPFEFDISAVEAADLHMGSGDPDDEPADESEATIVVYLAEGSQLGYLPIAACKVLGWR